MEYITSKENEKVKYIKSLNEKKYRQKYGQYYLEGIKVVDEAIDMYTKKAIDIQFIAYSYDIVSKLNGGENLINKINDINIGNVSNIPFINFKKEIFEYMVDTVTTQGILVVIKKGNSINIDVATQITNKSKNILILDGLQDQGNLGTIIRAANAFEIENILCTYNTTDAYAPKVLRSTMGSIFKVKLTYLSKDNIKEEIEKLKSIGYTMVATSLNSKNSIENFDFEKKYAFVIGNEANGISEIMQNLCDCDIKIPMSSQVDSLNAAVATGILLYKQFKK